MIRHCIPLLVVVALTGCWGKGEEGVPASGDPEADLRAEQRVGADERGDAEEGKEKARTLYDRLGGHEAISALVEDVTARVIADPRVNFERANVRVNVLGRKYKQWQATEENVAKFKKHMVEFLALAAGGPAEYTGVDMSH